MNVKNCNMDIDFEKFMQLTISCYKRF